MAVNNDILKANMDNKELLKKVDLLTKSRVHEICNINRKRPNLSDEDEKRFRQLWNEIDEIYQEFDRDNPLPPCKECGSERLAHLGGFCFNRGNCSLAIKFLGG